MPVLTVDNCSIHRSNEVKQWFYDNGMAKEVWPSYTSGFILTENVWAHMKRHLHAMHLSPDTLEKAVFSRRFL